MAARRCCLAHTLGGLLSLLFGNLVNGQVAPQEPIALHIEPQAVVDALNDWAHQTGFQVIFPDSEAANQLVAPRVEGVFTPRAGLSRLLNGTSLSFDFINIRTVLIRQRMPADPSEKIAADAEKSSSRGTGDAVQPEPGKRVLLEVIVTGSRLGVVPALGPVDGPAAITVFDHAKIEVSGASTVADLLKYLPQQPFTYESGFRASGGQFAELRGLGVDSTLVLINGRRTVQSAASVAFNAFDLNTIPLVAVERVEVLSDSAAAVYGADAIGGVINIIMLEKISRPVLSLHYGAAEGGGEELRASISAGYSNERLRALVALDYFDRGSLLGAQRDRWRDQDYRRYGSLDRRSMSTNPGNITSPTADNLPGLPSRFAAVPQDSADAELTPADFLATAGQRNRDSLQRYWSIVPEAERRSVAASVVFDLTPKTAAFGEFLHADRASVFQLEPSTLSSAVVPAEHPLNPFGAPVAIHYLFDGLGPRELMFDSELERAVAGLRGSLSSWNWEFSVVRSAEQSFSWVRNSADAIRVNAALASTEPGQALNVFQAGPGGSPALLASLVAAPVISRYASEGTQGAVLLRGAPVSLPAGDVDMVVGGEWRREDILYDSGPSFVSGNRKVSAAFAEMRIPLVNSHSSLPALQELSLTLAARHDHYSDIGGTSNPQYGLIWRPMRDLMLRVSYGTSFRPPSLFELYAERTVVPLTVADPGRRGEIASAVAIIGGNPRLDSVEAESFVTGVVLTPRIADGLRISGSYWRIKVDERVSFLPPQLVLAGEGRFAGRVVRAEPTPADLAQGLPGALTSVDISYLNFGLLETSGVDLSVSHTFDTRFGRFAPELLATWVEQYRAVNVPDTAAVERVGRASIEGTIPRWRAVATLGWKWRGIGLSATMRYLPSYNDATLIGPTNRVIPAQTLVDLQAAVAFDELIGNGSFWTQGVKITAGASNLFDKTPQFAEIGLSSGYDVSQGDLRQRFGYLKLSKSF